MSPLAVYSETRLQCPTRVASPGWLPAENSPYAKPQYEPGRCLTYRAPDRRRFASGSPISRLISETVLQSALSVSRGMRQIGPSISRRTDHHCASLHLAIVECLLPFRGPERPCVSTLLVFELVAHPEQRAMDHGAIIAGEVHDP